MVEIVVPALGVSVTQATIAKWIKKEGDAVNADEPIVELETDKVTLEINAPTSGAIKKIIIAEGETVEVGAIVGELEEGVAANVSAKMNKSKELEKVEAKAEPEEEKKTPEPEVEVEPAKMSPAVRKLVVDNNLKAESIPATGKDGRLTKEDVQKYMEDAAKAQPEPYSTPTPSLAPSLERKNKAEREERVRITNLRKVIASRLKEAQNTAAMLTTFNEVDMGPVMGLRKEYKDLFEKRHGVKLGFMAFFVKATIRALKEFPAVNAEIDGDEIVYKNYYDIGVAVSTPQGLVVPVMRDADEMTMAQIEAKIVDMGARARDGKLSMDEMMGGTFTITNGGVFGSLLSTPILNTPQSGILGMHKIQQRPMVMSDGSIEARPMMYLAHSYDHRIIDGREAVSFLVRIKEALEDPQRLLLDV